MERSRTPEGLAGPILPMARRPGCLRLLTRAAPAGPAGCGRPHLRECNAAVRTAPAADPQHTLDEMEATLEVATARCPHCGSVNLSPGLSEILAFVCQECDGRRRNARSSMVIDCQPATGN